MEDMGIMQQSRLKNLKYSWVRILQLIERNEPCSLTIVQISERLDIPRSTVHHAIKKMEGMDLITRKKEGICLLE